MRAVPATLAFVTTWLLLGGQPAMAGDTEKEGSDGPKVFQGKRDKEPRIVPGGTPRGGTPRPYPKSRVDEAAEAGRKFEKEKKK